MRFNLLILIFCLIGTSSYAADDTGFPVGFIAAVIKICSEGKPGQVTQIEEAVLAANCVSPSQMGDQKKILEYHHKSKNPQVRAAFDADFDSTISRVKAYTKDQKDEMCRAMTRKPTSC